MERLRGGELFQKILDKKSFNEFEARYVFQQLVDGLEALHSKRIMHRDLKPENVLISDCTDTPDGLLINVKLCDYGLSKCTQGAAGGSAAKTVVGTPQYW